MKKNRLVVAVISLVLALVMAMSLSITAFAASRTTGFGIISNILSSYKRAGITVEAPKSISGNRYSLIGSLVNLINGTKKTIETIEDIITDAPGIIPIVGDTFYLAFDGETFTENGEPVEFTVEWDALKLGYRLGRDNKYIVVTNPTVERGLFEQNEPVIVNITATDTPEDATIWHQDVSSGALYTNVPVSTTRYQSIFTKIKDLQNYKFYLCTRYDLLTKEDVIGTSLFINPKVTFTSTVLHEVFGDNEHANGHVYSYSQTQKAGVGHHFSKCTIYGCEHSEINECDFVNGVCTLCGQTQPTASVKESIKYSNNINRTGLFRTMFVRPEYHYVYTITVDSAFDISRIKVNGVSYKTTDAYGRFVIDNGEAKLNINNIAVIDTNGNKCEAIIK